MAISNVSRQPDLYRASSDLIQPQMDTPVNLSHFLRKTNRVLDLDMRALPEWEHFGGLHIFSVELLPDQFGDYVRGCLRNFLDFFYRPSQQWLFAESTVLLHRLQEFAETIDS